MMHRWARRPCANRSLPRTRRRSRIRACLVALPLCLAAACADDEPVPFGEVSGEVSEEGSGEASREAPAPAEGIAPGAVDGGPPSIVLIVIESLRTDAVASYGPDRRSPLPLAGTSVTPRLDALAAEGTRYAWAMAASSSSVTSHGSLLTGGDPVEHGAGLWTATGLPDGVETLAESLAAAGYETVGFSENPMAGPEFGFDRGFDRFVTPQPEGIAERLLEGRSWTNEFRVVGRVKSWLAGRDASKPYFLFVNLADPHLPYTHRTDNAFLPEDTPKRLVDRARGGASPQMRLCRSLPTRSELDVLAALYLDEVASADAKLGALQRLLAGASANPPTTLVTSDHGALLGEERLLGHRFAANNRVLRVPLVVSGPGAAPGVVETPVAGWRVADTIRCLAGLEGACADALPLDEATARSAPPIVSVVGNETPHAPPAALVDTRSLHGDALWAIANCPIEAGYTGRVVSYLKPPHKLVWRQFGPETLFDLSWDANEQSDQMKRGGERARALLEEVEAFVTAHRLDRTHREPDDRPLPERTAEAFLAGRDAFLAEETVATDIVWFGQLILEDRPDPPLRAWVEQQIPLHRDDPYYPIIDTTALSSVEVPAELPRGVTRFAAYLLAAVGGPDAIALPAFQEYLAIEDATEYILSHQISGLGWARALDRPLPESTYARMDDLLARMAVEHAADDRFRDLWAERAAFLTIFGEPSLDELERWSDWIVEHHLGNGDWGHTATPMTFDGDTQIGQHPRAHVRGMSMVVLSRYLKRVGDPGLPNPPPNSLPNPAP